MSKLTILVPAYNEAAVLPELQRRVGAVLDTLDGVRGELLIVDDGSRDETPQVLAELAARDPRVSWLRLSRNFGKEAAMTAGLDHADGDAVIILDADLQDPPELIPELLAKWRDGYDVVNARRTRRDGESWLKKLTAFLFYRVMEKANRVRIPRDTGDFRLLSRRAVASLRQLREQHRFMKGLFAWIGYPTAVIEYRRAPRAAGETKFNYWKLWNFALEGITSFTIVPLKIATYLGLLTSALAFAYGTWIIAKTLIWGDTVRGYPTLMVTILFLGGVQLFFTGVLGEYLGRIFNETKSRPLYLISAQQRSGEAAEPPVPAARTVEVRAAVV